MLPPVSLAPLVEGGKYIAAAYSFGRSLPSCPSLTCGKCDLTCPEVKVVCPQNLGIEVQLVVATVAIAIALVLGLLCGCLCRGQSQAINHVQLKGKGVWGGQAALK